MKKYQIFLLAILILFASCATIGPLADIGSSLGVISESQADAITETAEAGEKAVEDITPEQEYYIGRAVGATVLDQYNVWDDKDATVYLNKIGKAVSLFSQRPETFGGYFFLILDSDEINAFAAPSGHIFISKGMLKLTSNEDEIAAILAHEVSHVALKHGLEAIKKSRMTGFLTILGTNALKEFGSEDVAELTTLFEDSISDITSTLINTGYSRAFEKEADRLAVTNLEMTGYDKHALVRVINKMSAHLEPEGLDFAKTHPDPSDRLSDIENSTGLKGNGNVQSPSKRYKDALRNI